MDSQLYVLPLNQEEFVLHEILIFHEVYPKKFLALLCLPFNSIFTTTVEMVIQNKVKLVSCTPMYLTFNTVSSTSIKQYRWNYTCGQAVKQGDSQL